MSNNHNDEESKYNYWNTRILYLTDETLDGQQSEYALAMVDQIVELNSRDNSAPILIVIKSGGGDCSLMASLIDIMHSVSAPIYTQALGDVASSAAIILAAGESGHRYVSPMSRVMIHEPWTVGLSGQLSDIEISRNELKMWRDLSHTLMAEYTGQPLKKLQVDMRKDKWFSAKECVAYGMADHACIAPFLTELHIKPQCECHNNKKSDKKS